jgi:hypothetical protein
MGTAYFVRIEEQPGVHVRTGSTLAHQPDAGALQLYDLPNRLCAARSGVVIFSDVFGIAKNHECAQVIHR